MYDLYKDPEGRNIFVVPSPSHYNSGTAKSQIGSSLGNANCVDNNGKDVNVMALYKKIEVLENALTEQNSSKVCYNTNAKVKGSEPKKRKKEGEKNQIKITITACSL